MEARTPREVTQFFVAQGVTKAAQPIYVSFAKGWMAGWQLCFGAMLVQLVQSGCPALKSSNPALVNLLAASLFPVGLLMLFLTGNELLTAHLMFMPMSPIKGRVRLWQVVLNWLVIFFANLTGVLCFVGLVKFSGLYDSDATVQFARQVAATKTGEGSGPCVLRGIGCNFLVCSAVWLGTSGRDVASKVAGIYIPTALFVFLSFEHVVVNMYYVPMGIVMGAGVSTAQYIAQSLLPSLIGNLIGGCLLGIPMLFMHDTPDNLLTGFTLRVMRTKAASDSAFDVEAQHGLESTSASSVVTKTNDH